MKTQSPYLVALFLILVSCKASTDNTTSNQEIDWNKGKKAYLEYSCGSCHDKRSNDLEPFTEYVENSQDLSYEHKAKLLKRVLNNEEHKGKGVYSDKISATELMNIVEFIYTAKEKKVVN